MSTCTHMATSITTSTNMGMSIKACQFMTTSTPATMALTITSIRVMKERSTITPTDVNVNPYCEGSGRSWNGRFLFRTGSVLDRMTGADACGT